MFKDLTLTVRKGDKIAFVGGNSLAKTTLFQILAGELEPDSGTFRWGVTITSAYFPKENTAYFANDLNLIEWLGQYSPPPKVSHLPAAFSAGCSFPVTRQPRKPPFSPVANGSAACCRE